MRKFIVFALLVALLLSACSSTQWPMSERHKKYGLQALEIADAYLDFDITAEEAEKRLRALEKGAKSLPDPANKDEEFGDESVIRKVGILEGAAALIVMGGSSTSFTDARNSLAELLGEKTR